MKKIITFFLLLHALAASAAPTVDERLEWLENTVVHLQKLKGIPGPVGMPGARGPPGRCDDAPLRAQIAELHNDLAKLAMFTILLAVYVIFWK